jgi:ankyrin repeat protein
MKACYNGHEQVAQILIKGGAKVDATEKNGRTALMLAAYRGHVLCVRTLLENTAAVDVVQENGISALMFAVQENHINCARLLIDYKANVNARKDNRTVLMQAVTAGYSELVHILLQSGADKTQRDNDGKIAYDYTQNITDMKTRETIQSILSNKRKREVGESST